MSVKDQAYYSVSKIFNRGKSRNIGAKSTKRGGFHLIPHNQNPQSSFPPSANAYFTQESEAGIQVKIV